MKEVHPTLFSFFWIDVLIKLNFHFQLLDKNP